MAGPVRFSSTRTAPVCRLNDIQDETVSRSASTASGAQRGRASRSSTLEGVGPVPPRAPRTSSSTESVLAASREELEGVGVPARPARSIYAQLHEPARPGLGLKQLHLQELPLSAVRRWMWVRRRSRRARRP